MKKMFVFEMLQNDCIKITPQHRWHAKMYKDFLLHLFFIKNIEKYLQFKEYLCNMRRVIFFNLLERTRIMCEIKKLLKEVQRTIDNFNESREP